MAKKKELKREYTISLNEENIHYLVKCGLSVEKIAGLFGVGIQTIRTYFGDYIRELKRSKSFKSIPERQKASLVDPRTIERLSTLGHTVTEIANALNITRDTVRYQFQADFDQGQHNFHNKIRAGQMKLVERGDSAMLRHLGKTVLEQRERIENVTTHNSNHNLTQTMRIEVVDAPQLADLGDSGKIIDIASDVEDGEFTNG